MPLRALQREQSKVRHYGGWEKSLRLLDLIKIKGSKKDFFFVNLTDDKGTITSMT